MFEGYVPQRHGYGTCAAVGLDYECSESRWNFYRISKHYDLLVSNYRLL
jgi:hypothetical protein